MNHQHWKLIELKVLVFKKIGSELSYFLNLCKDVAGFGSVFCVFFTGYNHFMATELKTMQKEFEMTLHQVSYICAEQLVIWRNPDLLCGGSNYLKVSAFLVLLLDSLSKHKIPPKRFDNLDSRLSKIATQMDFDRVEMIISTSELLFECFSYLRRMELIQLWEMVKEDIEG